jgi:hypothetical protein
VRLSVLLTQNNLSLLQYALHVFVAAWGVLCIPDCTCILVWAPFMCVSVLALGICFDGGGLALLMREVKSPPHSVRPHETTPPFALKTLPERPTPSMRRVILAVWPWIHLVCGNLGVVWAQTSCSAGSVFNTTFTQCVMCPGGVFCLGGANPTLPCPAGTQPRILWYHCLSGETVCTRA